MFRVTSWTDFGVELKAIHELARTNTKPCVTWVELLVVEVQSCGALQVSTVASARYRERFCTCLAKMTTVETEISERPLAGKTIVITRARTQADEFVTQLERYGAEVIICPTIEIKELENYERLDEAIDHLYGYDWLIFTSVNGVDHFFKRFEQRGRDAHELDEIKVCAIGDATAEKLRSLAVHVDVVPTEFKAEGVYAALKSFVGGPEALRGLNILLPRASVARDFLPKALEQAGARIDIVPAYVTSLPDNLDKGHVSAMLSGSADCIAFTSSSTVRNLGQLFDTQDLSSPLAGVVVACIGDVTSTTAAEYGLSVDIQPKEFTIPALARAIAEHFANCSES